MCRSYLGLHLFQICPFIVVFDVVSFDLSMSRPAATCLLIFSYMYVQIQYLHYHDTVLIIIFVTGLYLLCIMLPNVYMEVYLYMYVSSI